MYENEDVILPDDFTPEESTPPQEDSIEETPEVQETTTDEVESTTTQPEGVEEAPKIKVKFNHEEMELGVDEAAPLIQKGMNYDKAVQRAQQEAKDSFIASLGYEWNGKPITTEAEYNEAIREHEIMQMYQDKDLPDEVKRELIENRKFREQQQAKEAELAEQERIKADNMAFMNAYPDVKPADIPESVWQEVDQGKSLVDAYARYENQQLKARIKVLEQNEKNSKKAPVAGVTTHGSTSTTSQDPFEMGFDSVL